MADRLAPGIEGLNQHDRERLAQYERAAREVNRIAADAALQLPTVPATADALLQGLPGTMPEVRTAVARLRQLADDLAGGAFIVEAVWFLGRAP
jgi:hypothetical protein